MPNTKILKENGQEFYPVTHASLIVGMENQGRMDATYAWDGTGTPDITKIPAGVVVTYDGTSYTGTLAASADTAGRFYLVPSTTVTGEYDRYLTDATGSTITWKPAGTTAIPTPSILDNVTSTDTDKALSANQGKLLKDDLSQLEAEVDDLDGKINGQNTDVPVTKTTTLAKRITSGGGAWTNATNENTNVYPVTAGKTYHLVVPSLTSVYTVVYAFGNETRPDLNPSIITVPDPMVKGAVTNYEADIVIPTGQVALYVCFTVAGGEPTLTTKVQAEGLLDKVDDLEEEIDALDERVTALENAEIEVGAKQIDGTPTEISEEDVTLSFINGEYKSVATNSTKKINTTTSANNATIIIPNVSEGEIYDLKIMNAVTSGQLIVYFIFAASDEYSSILYSDISNYVTEKDAENHIYRFVVPAGTTKIFSACKVADEGSVWAKKIITQKELAWLKVTDENIDKDVKDDIEENASSSVMAQIDAQGKENHLWDSIHKPDFYGKKLVAFGDSITYGVSSPGLAVITDCYIKLFADYAGCSLLSNKAVSGATIVPRGGGNDIYNKVLALTGDADVIVIAGGTNDWNTGQTVGEFGDSDTSTVYGALKGICEFLNTNYPDTPVVFITPIPYTTPADDYPNHIAPLDDYRTAIYDVATYYGHSVVNGLGLGMPREQGGWNNTMCDDNDGCHPTALGHALYARSIAGKLL